ncbi:tail fiber domain-containing protein [Pseudooceanicola atlanticus]|uniref:tail fiber domain-containing protein n=1 Tax=Pseudooceanicola atlanticus TaxID=1461694 RepID=UPI002353F0C6|nr:tail fiber domain-containing protein [Pseudooceanicola atlanticus]
MGKGGGAPEAPNPRETAAAEAQYNRLDTYSPSGGGVRHGYTNPTTNEFTPGIAPEGAQSAVQSIETDTQRQIREQLEPAAVDFTGQFVEDNVTNMPGPARVEDRSDVAEDLFNRNFSLMAPGIDRANSRLITNLQARGLPIGGEAWNDAYGEQVAQTQDTISRLAQDSNVAAGQEQSRQFGLDSAERSNAMSELMAVMGGNYQPPSNIPSGNASSVPYSSLVGDKYRADMASYNQQQQQRMSMASTLGGLGAALIKSDVKSKMNVQDLEPNWAAQVATFLPMYSWRYLPGQAPDGNYSEHIGPMAQDFHRMTGLGQPDKIHVIDYLGLLAAALQNALQRLEVLESQYEVVH